MTTRYGVVVEKVEDRMEGPQDAVVRMEIGIAPVRVEARLTVEEAQRLRDSLDAAIAEAELQKRRAD